ncbi:MAG: F0F1 ATP synthase subunit A [Firmicutes bacterium]|nr:F0F1 ATP synthase subunit A [Bacillota bacterium]
MIDKLYSIGMTDAMITSSVLTILIIIISVIVSRNLKEMPEGVQNMIEMGIEKLHNFFNNLMGEHLCKRYFPLVATLFIYILICNYTGLLPLAGVAKGFQAPTSSLNFTAGFAILVIILVQIIGIREHKGLGTYKRMVMPFAFMLPLMLIDELAKPISLSLRLYGNTFGDEEVVHVLSGLFPVGLPVIMQFLIVILALVQALVFSLLTAIYIGEACEKEHL